MLITAPTQAASAQARPTAAARSPGPGDADFASLLDAHPANSASAPPVRRFDALGMFGRLDAEANADIPPEAGQIMRADDAGVAAEPSAGGSGCDRPRAAEVVPSASGSTEIPARLPVATGSPARASWPAQRGFVATLPWSSFDLADPATDEEAPVSRSRRAGPHADSRAGDREDDPVQLSVSGEAEALVIVARGGGDTARSREHVRRMAHRIAAEQGMTISALHLDGTIVGAPFLDQGGA